MRLPSLQRTSILALEKLQGVIGSQLSRLRRQAGIQALGSRPDDIFVVSYPKSGTTLMQMMLYQMTTDGTDFPHIGAVVPYLELEMSRGNLPALRRPSPRIFKSHLKYQELPHHGRSVYMVRDVRDIALSAYHHDCMVTGIQQDLSRFLDRFIEGKTRFGSWFEHIASWWPHRHDSNVLFLRYEDVAADPEGTVRRVAGFCGLQIPESEMPRILERCSLSYMKQHTEKFDPRLRRYSGDRWEFIRNGRRGEGAQALSEEQRERLAGKLRQLERELAPAGGDPLGDILQPKPGS